MLGGVVFDAEYLFFQPGVRLFVDRRRNERTRPFHGLVDHPLGKPEGWSPALVRWCAVFLQTGSPNSSGGVRSIYRFITMPIALS
jgi:hypothetical protein